MEKRYLEIAEDALAAANGDILAAKSALCDGQYLTSAGYTDNDQTDIELAYIYLRDRR